MRPAAFEASKVAILAASAVAGIVGFVLLLRTPRLPPAAVS